MILAIDTATRWIGLALHNGTTVTAEHGWRAFNTQTIEVAPAIQEILKREGITAVDLSGIAVAIGPGSYTGLRVGLAVAKGMAMANQTPLVGISTLDIVAASLGPAAGKLLIVAEAGRSRVCAATYLWYDSKGWCARGEAVIDAWENILPRLEYPTTITGEVSAQAADLIHKSGKGLRVLSAADSVRRAGYLAELGWQRLRQGKGDDARTLAPIYLRNPDGSQP